MLKLFSAICAAFVSFGTAAVWAQDIKGDAKAGEGIAAMCIGCHGIKGYQASFPEVYRVPMISGQSAKYIVAALNAYKKGDRKHPTMRAISESLTDQNMADLAAFYSEHGLPGGKSVAPKDSKPASPAVAALLAKANCASCHGANFSAPIDPSYPKIGGQHADYLFVALKAYKKDANQIVGRNNAIMSGFAKQYTHAELKQIANYLAALEGDLKVVPQSRFR
ncbi:MAG: c-type cytochrome [Betaproteobacteria bacterium]|nr:c-type cytochrome [Betaproteobacteria bacterium]